MSLVILENRTRRPRRMLTLNLPREIAPVRSVVRTRVESKDGVRRIKVLDRNVGGSLRIPFGSVSQPIPETYLAAPELVRVIKAREVRVIRQGDPRWDRAIAAANPKRARDAARKAARDRAAELERRNAEIAKSSPKATSSRTVTDDEPEAAEGGPKTRRRRG